MSIIKSKAKILKIDKKTNTSIVELIIHEGKNHQVKKMFEAIGYSVLKLKRESIAFFQELDTQSSYAIFAINVGRYYV